MFQRRLLFMRPACRANFQCCVMVDSSYPTIPAIVTRSTDVVPRGEAVPAVAASVRMTFGLSAEADSRRRNSSKSNVVPAPLCIDAARTRSRYQSDEQMPAASLGDTVSVVKAPFLYTPLTWGCNVTPPSLRMTLAYQTTSQHVARPAGSGRDAPMWGPMPWESSACTGLNPSCAVL